MSKKTTVLATLLLVLGATAGYLAARAKAPARVAAREEAAAEIDRSERPIPDARFKGVAKRTLAGSKPDFPSEVTAPKDAPNALLILVDDAGFGNPSTFGGHCQTPDAVHLLPGHGEHRLGYDSPH
jgi:arylsulfatase